jgi:hypothetical protein
MNKQNGQKPWVLSMTQQMAMRVCMADIQRAQQALTVANFKARQVMEEIGLEPELSYQMNDRGEVELFEQPVNSGAGTPG